MKKVLIILLPLILIVTFLYLGKTAIVSTTGNTFAEKIASKIPQKHKEFLKDTFFKNEKLKLQIRNQAKQIKELTNIDREKNKIVIDKYKKIYFQKPFELLRERNDYNIFLYQTKFLTNGKNDFAIASGYIDIFNDNLIMVTGDGFLFKINLLEFEDKNTGFYAEIINTNLKDIITTPEFFKKSYFGIKDILISNEHIFLSFSNEIKNDCFNTGILKAQINYDFLEFKKISISEKECAKKGKMDNALQGGRLVEFKNDELLFTHGDWFQNEKAQDKNSIFGKILKFNHVNNTYEIISYGHRNPQGLLYLKNENLIYETEHGPIGGDEINFIDLNKNPNDRNYGWPIASYGLGTQQNASTFSSGTKKYKSHEGFIEPIKYYDPSIGISEIVKVPSKFFKNDKENDSHDFFVSSLGTKISEGDLSLHHLKINKKTNEIISEDIIHIQERIRDVIYYEKMNSLILFIESDRMKKGGPSLAIFKKK